MLFLIVCFIAFEVLYIMYNGSAVPRPTIPRDEQVLGSGPTLHFVVLGDSTAIAQGGAYQRGYAVASAQYLAKNHTVHWKNVAVSGARAKDVTEEQIPKALPLHPDVALIAVGANDVTHLTNLSSFRNSLVAAITTLQRTNPQIKIVLTGSPDMGSVPRFAQPVRWLAGKQTERVNRAVAKIAREQHVTFAPIAQDTGPTFRAHPELFARDKFHPNDKGYALWLPVIYTALAQAGFSD